MAVATKKTIPGPQALFGIETIREMQSLGMLGFIEKNQQTYGDIFAAQVGPIKMIFVGHPDGIREVLVTNKKAFTKGSAYDSVREYLIGNGLVTSVGDDWLHQRRVVAPYFTPRAVMKFAEMMVQSVGEVLQDWEDYVDNGQYLDVDKEMVRAAAIIILRAIFSVQDLDKLDNLKGDVEAMLDYTGHRQRKLIKFPLWVPTEDNRVYIEARDRVRSYVNDLIAHRRTLPEDQLPDDLLTSVMQSVDANGQPVDEDYIFDQSITFFVAGFETSARALSMLFYNLTQNPDVEAKLIEEVDRVIGDGDVTVELLKQMPYTLQVIKESMRVYGVVPFYPRNATEDTEIMGYPVQAGDMIMLSPHTAHRHPDFWDNPEQFDPMRFTPEAEKARHPQAYTPFSDGQRICVGNNFALLEIQIIVAMIYTRFRPKLKPNHDPDIKAPSLMIAANGLPMTLERR